MCYISQDNWVDILSSIDFSNSINSMNQVYYAVFLIWFGISSTMEVWTFLKNLFSNFLEFVGSSDIFCSFDRSVYFVGLDMSSRWFPTFFSSLLLAKLSNWSFLVLNFFPMGVQTHFSDITIFIYLSTDSYFKSESTISKRYYFAARMPRLIQRNDH